MEVKNKELYNRIKNLAKKKFVKYPSIYANAWVIKEYKKRGGKFKSPKPKNTGLNRWFKEKWVDLTRKKKSGKGYESCGRKSASTRGKYPVCRPSYVVSSKKTPKTYSELTISQIEKAKRQKQKVKQHRNIQFGGKASNEYITITPKMKQWASIAEKLKSRDYQNKENEFDWDLNEQIIKKDKIKIADLEYIKNKTRNNYKLSKKIFDNWKNGDKNYLENNKNYHIIRFCILGGPEMARIKL
jgi:hypothetical protein